MDNGLITFKLLFYFFLYFILPGFLILRLFFSRIKLSFFSVLPYAFAASLAVFFPVTLILYLFKWPTVILPITSLGLSAFLLVWSVKGRAKFFKEISLPSVPIIVLTLITVVIALVIINNLNTSLDGDALYHLSFIRKLAENVSATPYDAMFKVDKIPGSYGYNTWYLQLAGLIKMSGLDSTQAWLNLSSILVLFALFAWGNLAHVLFNREKFALITIIGFIIYQGFSTGFFEWQLIPYPDQICRTIILPIVIGLIYEILNKFNKRSLIIISLITVMATFIHLNFILFLFIILIPLALYYLVTDHGRFFKILAYSITALLLPAFALNLIKIKLIGRFVSGLPEITILRDDGFWVFKNYFIINPLSNFDKFSLIFLISFLVIILLLLQRKWLKSSWLVYIALTTVLPIFILFNPVLTAYASKFFTYTYIHRLWRLISLPLISTALIFIIYQRLKNIINYRWPEKITNNFVLAFVSVPILFLPLFFNHGYDLMKNNTYNIDKTENYFNGKPQTTQQLINWININLPKGNVYLSDPWTSYRISSLTNNYIVASLWQHFSPVVNRTEKTEQNLFVLTSNDMGSVFNILNENKVKYIVVNRPYAVFKSYANFEEKLRSFNDFFIPIYENPDYALFKYNYSEETLNIIKNSTYNLVNNLYNINDYKNALLKLKTLVMLDNNNVDYLTLYEKIRSANKRSLGDQTNIMNYAAGAKIIESSGFFPYPNSLEALIDGKIYNDNDYAAAKRNDLPNWFIVDFQIPREISSYEILWFSAKTSGKTWQFFAEKNGEWVTIDSLKDQSMSTGYHCIFKEKITASKIKYVQYSSYRQNRLLIKELNVY